MANKKTKLTRRTPSSAFSEKQRNSNLLGALAYVLGAITGIIMYFVRNNDPFVRFHAIQSIMFSVAVLILHVATTMILGVLTILTLGIGIILIPIMFIIIGFGSFVVWIYVMYKAILGEKYRLPIIGELADRYSGS
ncbi:DUF4870 domain-containing protein [Candidatus Micrarchaeota archaeon]|nr:DUF4870 domain-containing protein [Candidatus Micrarchaeota archaeon]